MPRVKTITRGRNTLFFIQSSRQHPPRQPVHRSLPSVLVSCFSRSSRTEGGKLSFLGSPAASTVSFILVSTPTEGREQIVFFFLLLFHPFGLYIGHLTTSSLFLSSSSCSSFSLSLVSLVSLVSLDLVSYFPLLVFRPFLCSLQSFVRNCCTQPLFCSFSTLL